MMLSGRMVKTATMKTMKLTKILWMNICDRQEQC